MPFNAISCHFTLQAKIIVLLYLCIKFFYTSVSELYSLPYGGMSISILIVFFCCQNTYSSYKFIRNSTLFYNKIHFKPIYM